MRNTCRGFTLAELLIALAILGVIATFTIPKVLQSQQDSKFNAIAKEAAASFVVATQTALRQKGLGGNTNAIGDIAPYLNYVREVTTGYVDFWQGGGGSRDCSWGGCYRLHNGAMLYMDGVNFGGTGSTNAISFYVDPDGKVTSGSDTGPGRAVIFFLYYSGRLRTIGTILPNTCDENQCWPAPDASEDPPWFSWN